MARPYLADTLREKVAAAAQYRCGYCQTSQLITGMPMHSEHLIPFAAD